MKFEIGANCEIVMNASVLRTIDGSSVRKDRQLTACVDLIRLFSAYQLINCNLLLQLVDLSSLISASLTFLPVRVCCET